MRARHEQLVSVCDTEQQVCHDFINLIGSQHSSIMIVNMRQEKRGATTGEEFPSWFASLSTSQQGYSTRKLMNGNSFSFKKMHKN